MTRVSQDTVTYHTWWWIIAIFCCLDWDDQNLLPYVFHSLQGFSGHLARCLWEDATLNDIPQMLDKHYGMVMTFNTLSKGLYSLKHGSGENVAKFRIFLSQQEQIL